MVGEKQVVSDIPRYFIGPPKTGGYVLTQKGKKLMERDKVSLDIFWLKDKSLEDSENLPEPDELARDIADGLESALEEFRGIYEALVKE